MRNQLAAAERKAKKAATAAEAGPSGAPAGRAKKGGSRKKTAAAKLEAEGDNEAGPSGAAPQLPSSKAEQDGATLVADAANGAPFLANGTVGCWTQVLAVSSAWSMFEGRKWRKTRMVCGRVLACPAF